MKKQPLRPTHRTTSRHVTVRVRNDLVEALALASADAGVSRGEIINEAILNWLKANNYIEPDKPL
jgi:predicted HicB family RNase H-like nuclease